MHRPFDVERPNSAGYHRWVKGVFLWGRTRSHPRGGGASVPKNYGTVTYAHAVWARAIEFGMVRIM